MAWIPEQFTPEQRFAAAKAIVHAQVSVDRLDRSEFGADNAEVAARIYSRVDDLLAMIHEDIYGLAGAEDYPPPSAS
jgi:hypothetical protein